MIHRFTPCRLRPEHGALCWTCMVCQTHRLELPPYNERGGCGSRPQCSACDNPAVIRVHGEVESYCWADYVRTHPIPTTDLSPFVGRPRLRLVKSPMVAAQPSDASGIPTKAPIPAPVAALRAQIPGATTHT